MTNVCYFIVSFKFADAGSCKCRLTNSCDAVRDRHRFDSLDPVQYIAGNGLHSGSKCYLRQVIAV